MKRKPFTWICAALCVLPHCRQYAAAQCECEAVLSAIASDTDSIAAAVNSYLPWLVDIDSGVNFLVPDVDEIRQQAYVIASDTADIYDAVVDLSEGIDAIDASMLELLERIGFWEGLETLQTRLIAMQAVMEGIEDQAGLIQANTDGIEGLITSTNSLLGTAGTLITGTNNRLDTSNTRLSAIQTSTASAATNTLALVNRLGYGTSGSVEADFDSVIAELQELGESGVWGEVLDELEAIHAELVAANTLLTGLRADLGYATAERDLEDDMFDLVAAATSMSGDTAALRAIFESDDPIEFDASEPWDTHEFEPRAVDDERLDVVMNEDRGLAPIEGSFDDLLVLRDEMVTAIEGSPEGPFEFTIPSYDVLGFASPEFTFSMDLSDYEEPMADWRWLPIAVLSVFCVAMVTKEFTR